MRANWRNVLVLVAMCACAGRRTIETAARGATTGPQAWTPSVTIIDLSSRFLAFHDSASRAHADPDTRWLLWKQLDGFAAVPPTPFGDTLARRLLDSAWSRYPAAMPRIRQGVRGLGFNPDSVMERVVDLLGCGRDIHVQLFLFVGGFEANAFAFTARDGTPAIAIPLETGDPQSSAVHEFTHAVHRSRGCANITSGYAQSLPELVMSEGIAMRATQRLLPGRPDARYVGGTPAWLDSAQARRAAILQGIREHLTDSGAGTAQRFTFGRGTTGIGREAYYAGWVVTGALLASGVSFHDIATTPPGELASLLIRGIDLVEHGRQDR